MPLDHLSIKLGQDFKLFNQQMETRIKELTKET